MNNSIDKVYGIMWILIFGFFSYAILSDMLYQPDANGIIKVNFATILLGHIIDAIGKLATGAIVFVIGLIIGASLIFKKKKNKVVI